QWRGGGEASPLTAAGPSRTCTGVPSPLADVVRESTIAPSDCSRARPRRRAGGHAAALARLGRGRPEADARPARPPRRPDWLGDDAVVVRSPQELSTAASI